MKYRSFYMNREYNLVTQCTFQAPVKAVWDVTVNVTAYPEWWACIDDVVIQGNEPTLQENSDIHYTIKGFLPHSLRFQTHVTKYIPFSRIEMSVSGDLEGTGFSTLDEHNGITLATFHWNVALTPPLLKYLSQWKLFHKIFVWNHDFAMKYAIKNMQKRVHHAST
jgi:uncharacterized protein YndB with AHSA1/START domain